MERKQRVLIVGGGFAGRTARRLLLQDFDVALVDAKGYFEYVPAVLRCFVEPSHARNIILKHPEGTVMATVVFIDANKVTLSTGEVMEFDYCLLCTGSLYALPIKPDLTTPSCVDIRVNDIQEASLELAAAERIVIVGGGIVGVELAAEIAGKWKRRKRVILITCHDNLLERMPEKAQSYARHWMEQHGVELIFNERVVRWELPVQTDKGREIEADLVYKCIGFKPATDVVNGSQGSAPFQVDPVTLQLRGFENVFACGDCTSTGEEKTAFAADLSGQLVAKNVLRHSRKQPLLRWPQDVCQGRDAIPHIMCVSLYKHDAILQINGLVITGYPATFTKHRIEQMQLALAHERTWATYVWSFMETSNLWMSRLF